MREPSNLRHIPSGEPPPQSMGGSDGGNGGGLVNHRLGDLERRMGKLEASVNSINETVIKIDTKMDSVANKAYMMKTFGVTGLIALLTLVAHIAIRAIGE